MLFSFFSHWLQGSLKNESVEQELPLTEKSPGEQVHYTYPVKKVRVQPNIEIAYIDEGSPDAPVLLFIHGLAGGIPGWQKNIPVLRKQYRCIALDLPGHGLSAKGDFAYDMEFFTGVVLLFLDALGFEKVTIVGHSMGGQIAIILALKVPSRVSELILVSPAGIEPYTPIEKQTIINMTVAMSASGQAFTQYRMNYFMAFNHNPKHAGELVTQLPYTKEDAAMMSRLLVRAIESILLASVNRVLHRIRQRCLVLVGNEDQVSPYQYFHRQGFAEITKIEVAKIPYATLRIFSPCGHYVQYQRPRTFNKEVVQFLSNT